MGIVVIYWKPGLFGFADFIRGIYHVVNTVKSEVYVKLDPAFSPYFIVREPPSSVDLTKLKTLDFHSEKKHEDLKDVTDAIVICNYYPQDTSIDISRYIRPSPLLLLRVKELSPSSPFVSLHFRTGDAFLLSGTCKNQNNLEGYDFSKEVHRIVTQIKQENPGVPIIFHSDNQALRLEATRYGMQILNLTPIHVRDTTGHKDEVRDSFAEFYVISQAQHVYIIVNSKSHQLRGRYSQFAAIVGGKPFTIV